MIGIFSFEDVKGVKLFKIIHYFSFPILVGLELIETRIFLQNILNQDRKHASLLFLFKIH